MSPCKYFTEKGIVGWLELCWMAEPKAHRFDIRVAQRTSPPSRLTHLTGMGTWLYRGLGNARGGDGRHTQAPRKVSSITSLPKRHKKKRFINDFVASWILFVAVPTFTACHNIADVDLAACERMVHSLSHTQTVRNCRNTPLSLVTICWENIQCISGRFFPFPTHPPLLLVDDTSTLYSWSLLLNLLKTYHFALVKTNFNRPEPASDI